MNRSYSARFLVGMAAVMVLIGGCSDRTGTIPGISPDGSAAKNAILPDLSVEILIKPGEAVDPAPINLKAKGVLPVAVLGSAGFDALTFDPFSADFAGASVRVTRKGKAQVSISDVNEDRFSDIVLHFDMEALDLAEDAVQATLTGTTFDGRVVSGSGAVRIVPQKGPPPPPPPPLPAPVLWNRLGSEIEVQNSAAGPGGTIVGAVNFNHDVQFGKGITPNTGYAGSGVDFPTTIADPEKGCIEMWAKFYFVPQWYGYGVYGLVNANHWTANVMNFSWYNGNAYGHSGFLYFDLVFNGAGSSLAYSVFDPPLDTPVHLAVVWDRNGIDGSGDFMRVYIDGAMAAAQNTSNGWGTDNTAGSFRVATTWDGSFATDRYSVDNIKIWDFAKTDFSDRFTE